MLKGQFTTRTEIDISCRRATYPPSGLFWCELLNFGDMSAFSVLLQGSRLVLLKAPKKHIFENIGGKVTFQIMARLLEIIHRPCFMWELLLST